MEILSSKAIIIPSPKYYFSDGDLVLLAEDPSCHIAFKVHRGKLREACTVFNHAFEANPDEENERYGGVPMVKLYDTVHEVCLLLEGMYSPSTIIRPPTCQNDLTRLDRFLRICDKYNARELLRAMTDTLTNYLSTLLDIRDNTDLVLPLDVYPTFPRKVRVLGFFPEPCHLLSIFLQNERFDLIAPAAFYLYRLNHAASSMSPSVLMLPTPQICLLPSAYSASFAKSQFHMDIAIHALYTSVERMMSWTSYCCHLSTREACHAALPRYIKVYRALGGHLSKTGLPPIDRANRMFQSLSPFCQKCERTFRSLVAQERTRFIEEMVPRVFGNVRSKQENEEAVTKRIQELVAPVEECAELLRATHDPGDVWMEKCPGVLFSSTVGVYFSQVPGLEVIIGDLNGRIPHTNFSTIYRTHVLPRFFICT